MNGPLSKNRQFLLNEIFVDFLTLSKQINITRFALTNPVHTHTVVVNNSSQSVDRDFPYCKVDKCMQSCSFLFWRLCSWRKPGAPSMFCSPRSKYGKSVPKWEYIDFHFLYLTVFHRFHYSPRFFYYLSTRTFTYRSASQCQLFCQKYLSSTSN